MHLINSILVDGFECLVSVKPYFHAVTNEISGYDLFLDIPAINVSERVTMYRDLSSKISWYINTHYFNLFNNAN